MAGNTETITIKLKDEASKGLKGLGKNMLKFSKIAAGMAVALGVEAVRQSIKFEKQMANIATLLDGDATDAIKTFEKGINSMLGEIPVTADDLGVSAYSIVSAGITDAADSLDVLENSAKLAVAGLGTTAEATDIMTSAINAFGIDASKSAEVSDILFTTVKRGKTTVAELTQSFGLVAPAAAAAGVQLDELQAATAALTTTGLTASVAQTQLKALFNEMTREGTKLAGAFDAIGIANVQANIESEGFVETLQRLKEEGQLTDTEFKNLFSSVEASGAALSLTGAQADEFTVGLADMRDGIDSITGAFEKQKETTDAQIQLLKGQFNVLLRELGNEILPVVNEGLVFMNDRLAELTGWLAQAREDQEAATKAVGESASAIDELGIAVENTGGIEKEFFSRAKKLTELQMKIDQAWSLGLLDIHEGLIKQREDSIKANNKWASEHKDDLEGVAESYDSFGDEAQNSLVRTGAEAVTNSQIITEASGDTNVALNNTLGAFQKLTSQGSTLVADLALNAETSLSDAAATTEVSGQHLLDNFNNGIESRIPNLSGTINRVMEQVNKLRFSTNPLMPTEVWGQHSMENFAVGMQVGSVKITEEINEVVGILLGFNEAQEQVFEDGIEGVRQLADAYDDSLSEVKSTVEDLTKSLDDIFGGFSDREAENREKLASAVVDNEQKIADLKSDLLNEEDGERRTVLEMQIDREEQARQANLEAIRAVEKEITEVKRKNGLTQLEKAVEVFNEQKQANEDWLKTRLEGFDEELKGAIDMSGELKAVWKDRTEAVLSFFGDELSKNDELIAGLSDSFKEVQNLIVALNDLRLASASAGFASGGVVQGFAKGGIAGFAGGGRVGRTDTVPAMLTPGEVILNAAQQKNVAGNFGGRGITININGPISSTEAAEEVGDLIVQRLQQHIKVV